MVSYVLWGEVQARLDNWYREHGSPIHFSYAIQLLRSEGAIHQAPYLPHVDFSAWDLEDLDEFHAMLDALPVDVGYFENAGPEFAPPSEPLREAMNILPLKIAAHQKTMLHAHDSYELLYVMKGSGSVSSRSGSVFCSEGTLCLIAPDFVHDVHADPSSEVLSISFLRDTLERILRKLLRKENVMTEFFRTRLSSDRAGYVLLTLPADRTIRSVVRNIFQEGYSTQEYARELCADYIELLFAYALRACATQPETHTPREKRMGVPMAAVLKYIQDHYRTVSLGEVSAVFHYEPDYLSRRIKVYMGRSYVELVLQLKIEAAKQLLQNTKLTIEQIAEQTGFGSAVHLSRTFRKKIGMSPSEFRGR